MQGWNQGHSRFSADLDAGLRHLLARFPGRRARRNAIEDPYGIPAETDSSLSSGAQASLRGLAASVLTVMLWFVVIALATPAPGLAAAPDAKTSTCLCIAYPPLA